MLLDCDANSFEQLVEMVLEKWLASRKLSKEKVEQIRTVLLLRQVHLRERQHKQSSVLPIIRSLADIAVRKHSNTHSNITKCENEHGECNSFVYDKLL